MLKQIIDYCGAGAHNQNGIIERTIGIMTNDSRTLLLGAMRRWPDMISTLLWPYAWKEVERRNNYFSYNRHGVHPIQSFANVLYLPRLRDWHTWGCPVFVLEDKAREHISFMSFLMMILPLFHTLVHQIYLLLGRNYVRIHVSWLLMRNLSSALAGQLMHISRSLSPLILQLSRQRSTREI